MFTLIVVAAYTVAILLFVPLERIGRWQESVKKTAKRLMDKI